MNYSTRALSVATAALLLAAVTACSSDDAPNGAPSPTASNSGSAPSPTATSPEDQASADAVEIVGTYYATIDDLRQDATTSPDALNDVAVGTQLTAQKNLLASLRGDGTSQTGDTHVADTQVQSVTFDNSDPESGKVPTVVIDVCWDVRDVDVLDSNGKSIVTADRPDTGWTRLTVANYSWDSNPGDGWRVAGGEDLEKAPCAA